MKKSKTNIIGYGEVTGHTHRVSGKKVKVFNEGDDFEMEVPSGGTITHEEHKTIEIPAGVYRVGGVLEYDPAAEEVRQVQD